MNGAPLLRLQLRGSPALAAALVLAHAAAAACIAAVLAEPWDWALAILVLALGAAAAWDRALLRAGRSVRVLELAAGGQAALGLADGRRLEGSVAARRNVCPWWVTLPVRGPAGRTLLIARGMLSEDDFRRLRLWALWGRVPGAAGVLRAA